MEFPKYKCHCGVISPWGEDGRLVVGCEHILPLQEPDYDWFSDMQDDGIPYSCWTDDPVDELEDEIE